MDEQFSDKLIENLDTSFIFELINPEEFVEYMESPELLIIDMRPPVRFNKDTILSQNNSTINLFEAMIGDYDEITKKELTLINNSEKIVIFDEESREITKLLLSYKLYEKLSKMKQFECFEIYLLKEGFKKFQEVYKQTISKGEERIRINS